MTMTCLYPYFVTYHRSTVTVKASALSFGAFATLWIFFGLGSAWRFRFCFGL